MDNGGKTSLWAMLTTVKINPENRKCTTLPILSLRNQYSRNFHLSWLGFWVAFLSWFAFSPLIPEAVKTDLNLTAEEIGNSNIISLCATLGVRLIVGPLVDKYGPRKVMAGVLALGAIPSGLAGTVKSAEGLYVVRFFIGILGGTFVPCQTWTTTFFDQNVVGRANALVGGWGNSGGGFTFLIMVALYDRLVSHGLSSHTSWRAAFAIVPVPVLLLVALITLLFGTDHPNGKWSDRFSDPNDGRSQDIEDNSFVDGETKDETRATAVVAATNEDTNALGPKEESLGMIYLRSLKMPSTWLPGLAYLTTFGYELAIDANLANVLFGLFQSPTFGQTKAGYVASIFGLLNVFTRPLGGYFGDLVFAKYRVPGKKYLTLACGLLQGLLSLALGLYIDNTTNPSLTVIIVIFVLLAIANEAGNGANFALVPHCNPAYNGFMSGFVGAMGNLGGIIFALIFRFQSRPFGKAFWVSGVVAAVINILLAVVPVPK
ncbi:hypothetical protein QCA50_014735 [Cerrena zonata]|uniref:Nitrate/nitrite transporter n=1 Tax=Cerrena zonata TaxID=2478898 RepID=A0AAW0FKC4_9APHY